MDMKAEIFVICYLLFVLQKDCQVPFHFEACVFLMDELTEPSTDCLPLYAHVYRNMETKKVGSLCM